MNVPLDELYFRWLYDQVGSAENTNPEQSHWDLLRELYKKEFVWIIGNDDNRAEDGRDLRHEFLDQKRIVSHDEYWNRCGCSIFELMIALARRLTFEAGRDTEIWFWMLVENLGLFDYNDCRPIPTEKIDDILDTLIWRTYKEDGRGGLFPLRDAEEDQRDVEIWYQLQSYLLEHGY